MNTVNLVSIVGARPNFIKIAPFIQEIAKYHKSGIDIHNILIHTGQHYDVKMSETFFKSLSIPLPDINLEVGSGTHAEQIGKTMIALEKVLARIKPDWVIVVGDVNATIAGSIIAKKLGIKVCHIEAGLRSNDMDMPEEINRIVTDRLSDCLLTPDRLSLENLLKEGTKSDKIEFVGNIMIDTLKKCKNLAKKIKLSDIILKNKILAAHAMKKERSLSLDNFVVFTIHRPSNVDNKEILESYIKFLLEDVIHTYSVVWPIHPRTKNKLIEFDLWNSILSIPSLHLLEPLGYMEMLRLTMTTSLLITDSGGLQEECCVLGTPCITLRWNTERPITLIENGGVNILVGSDIFKLKQEFNKLINYPRLPKVPELWDGKTAKRCLDAILSRS